MTTVSIVGTGGMAEAIATLSVRAGHAVELISRDIEKAQALAENIGTGTSVAQFRAVPMGDIVVLAVPYSVVLEVMKQFGDALAGKLIIDITNPINANFTDFVSPAGSSGAQEISKIAPPNAMVVKGFNFQFSKLLAAGSFKGRALDVFIAGDDAHAKQRVSSFIASLGLRPLDAGALSLAHSLEAFAMLSLGLIAHSIKHTNFTLGVSLSR